MATNVSAEALDESLENASQFWLISSAARKLSAAHFKVIIKHWKKVSVGNACGCECACKGVHVLLFESACVHGVRDCDGHAFGVVTQGLGLYIFGDNHPFFVDANRLLDALAVELEMKTPLLSGNNPGEHAHDR